MGKKSKNNNPPGVLARNRKATHDYQVLERHEAGVALLGTEVKSCRGGGVSLVDAYVRVEHGELWLNGAHIAPYDQGNRFNHEPRRVRRLLMRKREILKLSQQVKEKGLTLIPLGFYLKNGLIKVEVGVCRGKSHGDKRQTLRERQAGLEARRAMAARRG